MTEIRLRPPTLDDVDALLAFELANRAFFERWINARAPAFYQPDAVADSILALQEAAAADRAYGYLIVHGDAMVGRINLTAVERPYFNRATLGYRLAEHACGRGWASAAVAQLQQLAFGPLGLWRLEAHVGQHNPASRAVLLRNGFALYGQSEQSFCLHGQWHGMWHMACQAAGEPSLAASGRASAL
jgi:ribosomal-protein-alanine N-acetyltransferase